MDFEWHDVVGATGVLILLGTYFALQINYIAAQSLLYSILNALGAALILVSLRYEFNLSAFLIESAWFLISIIGAIVSIAEMRRRRAKVLKTDENARHKEHT